MGSTGEARYSKAEVGGTLGDLKADGVTAKEACAAGYTPAEAVQAGYTPDEMSTALTDQKGGGSSAKDAITTPP